MAKAQNTKIERLAEAFESLAVGIVASGLAKVNHEKPVAKGVTDFLKDARSEIRAALREFLAPSLRLVELGPRQDYNDDVDELDRTKCDECNRHHICADVQCPHWHKAVQGAIAQSVGIDECDDDGPAVA